MTENKCTCSHLMRKHILDRGRCNAEGGTCSCARYIAPSGVEVRDPIDRAHAVLHDYFIGLNRPSYYASAAAAGVMDALAAQGLTISETP